MRAKRLGFIALALMSFAASGQTLSPGAPANTFTVSVFVSGASQITDFRFLPDGRVVFTQKTGEVMVRTTTGTIVQAGTFPVDSSSEKGLLGVELHPQFGQGSNRTLFFYYSRSDATGGTDENRHRVVSITLADTNVLTANTETILVQNLRGPANHDGGGLGIGPDGKLYISVGDTGCNSNLPPGGTITNYTATCLTTANGKILRVNLDGTIPADNPLVGAVVPACDATSCDANPVPVSYTGVPRTEIWSWGFRNPFRFSFDPVTGNLWEGDVGEVTYEEINLVTKGEHYGWPYREGPFGYPVSTCDAVGPEGGGADCVDPKYFCIHGAATATIDGDCESITGGAFLDSPSWPAAFRGLYYFGDNANGNLWTLTPNAARDGFVANPRQAFGTGFGTPVRFLVGPDGNLYIANYTDNTIDVIVPRPGFDGGPLPDAGVDAGPVDAGTPDAGPRPDAGTPLDAGPINFGGGTPPGGLAGGVPFNTPDLCATCHDRRSGDADAGALYMPYDGWVSTMMANAIRDPLFQAALSVANQDVVGIGQWCLRCHSPSSYVAGHGLPPNGSALDAVDQSGVSCEVCHRSKTGPDGTALVGNAQLLFEASLLVHGPYDTTSSPAHGAVLDPFTSSSALCGQCHQVTNPLINVAGTSRGFPLDTTYLEWQQSALSSGPTATSCQQCHMEVFPGDHVVGGQGGGPRTDPRRHTFAGANVWGLDAVLAAAPELQAYADDFAATQGAARRSLAAAATVSIVLPPGPLAAGSLVPVKVQVQNLTGHKLPTGYADGRRVFVELSVNGEVVSGAYDYDAGTLVLDGQIQVFEAIHGQSDGGTDHIALDDTVMKDNRVPPLGFLPTVDTAPLGTSYPTDADGGVLGFAEATYQVPMPPYLGADGGVTVTARLFHQSTTRHYVEALAAANGTDDTGTTLASIYGATGMAPPVEMTSASVTAPLGPSAVTGGCGCTSTGGRATSVALIGLSLLLLGVRGRGSRGPGRSKSR
jgi:glucose/arabinose dehydrogenase